DRATGPRDPQEGHAGDAGHAGDRRVGRHGLGRGSAVPRARVPGLGRGAGGDRRRGVVGHRAQPHGVDPRPARGGTDAGRGDDRCRARDGGRRHGRRGPGGGVRRAGRLGSARRRGLRLLRAATGAGAGVARGQRDRRPHADARRPLAGL
ncbi:MAG: hypothetical protein AVDCRST_MAG34-20, partial [uncultured Nocardioidaceae bacterium]